MADEAQTKSVDHILKNPGSCEIEGNASSRHLIDGEMCYQTCIEMPFEGKLHAAENDCGEHQPLHDSVLSDMKYNGHLKTTSMKNNPQK